MLRVKQLVLRALNANDGGRGWERVVDATLITLVLLNALAVILESVASIYQQFKALFDVVEVVSVAFFSAEYLLRLWSATLLKGYAHPVAGRLRFMLRPIMLIDLLAILPFFVAFGGADFRVLRLLRLFRLLKVTRYVRAFNIIRSVVLKKRSELAVTLLVILVLLVLVSSLMFFIENQAQPDKFASIPETMWWGVATLTTVGYGDIYPVTPLGKLLSSVIAILGLGLFAIPTGILASGFSEQLEHAKEAKQPAAYKFCPHCGHELRG
jgi:voltage-gated potassium channel